MWMLRRSCCRRRRAVVVAVEAVQRHHSFDRVELRATETSVKFSPGYEAHLRHDGTVGHDIAMII